ncbi:MAG TPA: hypothetical protein PLB89_00765 [Flavobacteriales bacterium]|nr:hypothetical protein [Flavobacteriales bacterium]
MKIRSELGAMGKTISTPASRTIDVVHAVGVLEHMAASRKSVMPHEPGRLEVVRLLRETHRTDVSGANVDLVYAARPASKRSLVSHVHFHFRSGQEELPAPSLDKTAASLRLYYPRIELDIVLNALRSHKERFCYFWEAADGSRMRAWLFTPR